MTEPVLTPREAQVLKWIAGGWTASQIAERYHISTRTVESHRQNIIQKFNLQHPYRQALVDLARRVAYDEKVYIEQGANVTVSSLKLTMSLDILIVDNEIQNVSVGNVESTPVEK